jgi:hypothetical protein
MPETEAVSALITDIYDTVLDDDLWPDVLKRTADFVGGPSAAVWSKDIESETTVAHTWGFDPGYTRAYLEEYGRIDPASHGYLFANIGQPVTHAGLMDGDEFFTTAAGSDRLRQCSLGKVGGVPCAFRGVQAQT